jgi:XisH protein
MHDLYKAVGQYQFYNLMLKNLEPDRILYLALKDDVYFDNFEDEEISQINEGLNVKLLIFNPVEKTIVEWIK